MSTGLLPMKTCRWDSKAWRFKIYISYVQDVLKLFSPILYFIIQSFFKLRLWNTYQQKPNFKSFINSSLSLKINVSATSGSSIIKPILNLLPPVEHFKNFFAFKGTWKLFLATFFVMKVRATVIWSTGWT